jgi:hypothetical protein
MLSRDVSLDLALMVSDHIGAADRAHADVLAGGLEESWHAPHLHTMVAAFEAHRGRLVRHHLSPEGAQALEGAVIGRPRV